MFSNPTASAVIAKHQSGNPDHIVIPLLDRGIQVVDLSWIIRSRDCVTTVIVKFDMLKGSMKVYKKQDNYIVFNGA